MISFRLPLTWLKLRTTLEGCLYRLPLFWFVVVWWLVTLLWLVPSVLLGLWLGETIAKWMM